MMLTDARTLSVVSADPSGCGGAQRWPCPDRSEASLETSEAGDRGTERDTYRTTKEPEGICKGRQGETDQAEAAGSAMG